MKAVAALLLVFALLVAGIPYLTACQHEGKALALANGGRAPMKCHWTAQGEIALAVPLLGLAGALSVSRRRETRRLLGVLGVLLGLSVIALPTCLIGTCSMDQAACSLIMKPALILLGILTAGVSAAVVAVPEVRPRAKGQQEVPAPGRPANS